MKKGKKKKKKKTEVIGHLREHYAYCHAISSCSDIVPVLFQLDNAGCGSIRTHTHTRLTLAPHDLSIRLHNLPPLSHDPGTFGVMKGPF